MNPITFNDKFAAAINTHPDHAFMGTAFPQWQTAPLFDYDTTWERELALLKNEGMKLIEVFELPWPFETFRLCMTERQVPFNAGDEHTVLQRYVSHFLVSRKSGEFQALIGWRDVANKGVMTHVFTAGGLVSTQACLYIPRHGGWVNKRIPVQHVEQICGSALASLSSFIMDAAAPNNHIAQVRPRKGNHNVHWQQARTHYTIIAHGHPANSASVKQGERVAVDEAAIKRMAHNRRAHWRTYRHERFTYARGARRWIKQAWCGPKEWLDAGGKQIYKILEPVDAA